MNTGLHADLKNARISKEMFSDAIARAGVAIDEAYLYNYSAQKHAGFENIAGIKAHTFPCTANGKRVRMDVRQSVEILSRCDKTDCYVLMVSPVEAEYTLAKLRELGKKIILISEGNARLSGYADENIRIERRANPDSAESECAAHVEYGSKTEFLPHSNLHNAIAGDERMADVNNKLRLILEKLSLNKRQKLEKLYADIRKDKSV